MHTASSARLIEIYRVPWSRTATAHTKHGKYAAENLRTGAKNLLVTRCSVRVLTVVLTFVHSNGGRDIRRSTGCLLSCSLLVVARHKVRAGERMAAGPKEIVLFC